MPVSRFWLVAATLLALGFAACDVDNASSPPIAKSPASAPTATASPVDATVCAPPYPSAPLTVETVFCADPATMLRAPVIRIVDGDTIHVEIDGTDETVRFYGIDTAERGQPCFAEASDRVRELAGAAVLLRSDVRDQDRYQRLLRYVYTSDGLSIDATLISEGLARAWTDDGALREPMIALEATARATRLGCLWSPAG
jgi:micrococcal nuclease